MKIIPLNTCAKTDYHIRFLEAAEIPQKTENPAFSSVGVPKKQDMLLFVNNCRTRYVTKERKEILTKDGDVIYVPTGSEYTVDCIEQSATLKNTTFQINFVLFDETFSPFVLSDKIIKFTPRSPLFRELFEKAVQIEKDASTFPSEQKKIIFDILGALAKKSEDGKIDPVIEKGVSYLQTHYQENPSVAFLAELCRITPEYFRKLFKKQTGQTPIEYKNGLRLQKAKQYLLYSDIPVAEISNMLSFAGVSHFIKAFKQAYACPPLEFRNDFMKNSK